MTTPPANPLLAALGVARDLELIGSARDQQAWASLVETMGADITRLVTRLIGDPTLVQDAVHETLLLVRDHAHRFVPPEVGADAAARSWVLRVAANASLQLARRTRREVGRDRRAGVHIAGTAPTVAEPGEQMERADEAAVLRRELSALPPAYAEALALHYLAGQDYPALAAQLALPVNTVRSRIHRGLKALRGRLTRCGMALSLAALTGLLTDLGAQTVTTALVPASAAAVITSSATPTTAFTVTTGTVLATVGGTLMTSAISLTFVAALAIVVTPLMRGQAAEALPPTSPAVTAAVSADPVPPRPAAQGSLRKLMERGIALGFPDTRGATIFRGPLEVSSRTTAGATTTESFDGFHARLADGRWLVQLCYPLKAGATIAISTAKLEEWQDDQWRSQPALQAMVHLHSLQGSLGIHLAALFRSTAKQDESFYATATRSSGDLASAWYWAGPSPLGGVPSHVELEDERKPAFMSPENALRYALSRWFVLNLQDIHPPFLALPRQAAIAGAKAMLPGDDPAALTEIDRLAGMDEGAAPGAGAAPMAVRLTTWRTTCTSPRSSTTSTWRGSDEGETDANRFNDTDLPALVALLGDPRPSRWVDVYHPRTIGDQALRALSSVLRFDPRWLIGRDLNAAWNDHERSAVAAALGAWWKANQQATPEQLRLAVVSRMDPSAIVGLFAAAPAAELPQLYRRLPQVWKDAAPAGYEDYTYQLLMGGENVPELVATAKRWPLTGESRAMVTYWRFQHGDSAPLTAMLEDALAQRATPGTRAPTFMEALLLLSVKPDSAMVRRFQQVLAGDLASPPTKAIAGGCLGEEFFRFTAPESGWRQLSDGAEKYRKVLALVFLAQLLHDKRPLPPGLVAQAGPPSPQSHRIADLSAEQVRYFWWCVFASSRKLGPESQYNAPLEQRDQYIDWMNEYLIEVLPNLMTAVHLDVTIPGFDPAGEGKGTNSF